MNALIVIILVIIIVLIFDSAKKKASLEKYQKDNNASFVAEVEEFARWGELVFREYCDIVSTTAALSELKSSIKLYKCNNEFIMPKIIVKRRSCLGLEFRNVFENFKNTEALEILRAKHSLPTSDALQFDNSIRKSYRLCGANTINNPYYKSLYQILYLNVYLSLQRRQYKIGKNGIKEDEIIEHQGLIIICR